MPARPDLRLRIGAAVLERSSRPPAFRVVAASAALLLVGAVTFYVLLARHTQPAPVILPTPSVESPTPSVASPSPSPSPTPGWKTYTNTQFGFSISYPPGWVVQNSANPGSTLPRGILLLQRAVEPRFLGNYPPGQVEFSVRARDADTLNAWVQKHTGPCGSDGSKEYYWDTPSDLTSMTVAGHDARSFDWNMAQACGEGATSLHFTAFFVGTSYVFVLDWWSTDPAYAATVHRVADQMLASFSG